MQLDPDALADLIVNAIAVAMKSHVDELAAAHTRIAAFEGLVTKDVTRVEGYTSFLQRDLAAALDRIAVLEARAPEPGPPGPAGPAGRDGVDGKNAAEGHTGRYVAGKTYDAGDFVMEDGSTFCCKRLTTTRPGTSNDWQMWAMRGDRGKPGGRA